MGKIRLELEFMVSLLLGIILGAPQVQERIAPMHVKLKMPLTGLNGYEEYLAAVNVALLPEFDKLLDEAFSPAPRDENGKVLPPSTSRLEVKRQLVGKYGWVVDLIKKGNSKPITRPTSIEDSFPPELAEFKNIARLINCRADVAHAVGNSNQSTDDYITSFYFAQNVAVSGGLIEGLLGAAIHAYALANIYRHLDHLSEKDLVKLEKAATQILSRNELQESLTNERRRASKMLPSLLQKMAVAEFDGQETVSMIRAFEALNAGQKQILQREVMALLDRSYASNIAILNNSEMAWADLSKAEIERERITLASQLALYFSPPSFDIMLSSAMRRTQYRLLRLHCQILTHRWHHEKLPEKLDVLNKDYLHDPFSGQQFGYELSGTSYRLFSRGHSGTGEIELRYTRKSSTPGVIIDP